MFREGHTGKLRFADEEERQLLLSHEGIGIVKHFCEEIKIAFESKIVLVERNHDGYGKVL